MGKKPGPPKGSPRMGGRQPGTLNHATAEIRALAREWGPIAIQALATIVVNPDADDKAVIAAASELLDRGYGKSPQPLRGDDDPDAAPIPIAMVTRRIIKPK